VVKFPIAQLKAILTALQVTAAPLKNAEVHCYSNDVTPSSTSVLGDFTECVFDGYALVVAATWGTPYQLPDGSGQMVANNCEFLCSGNTVLENVVGVYVTTPAAAALVYAERFAAPVPITGTGSGFVYVPTVNSKNQ
jgi:hypothetical protein